MGHRDKTYRESVETILSICSDANISRKTGFLAVRGVGVGTVLIGSNIGSAWGN